MRTKEKKEFHSMVITFNGGGAGITSDHGNDIFWKKCYQQVEAVLKEDNGKVDSVLIITNFVEKGGGNKTEIGCGFSVENFRVKQTVQL